MLLRLRNLHTQYSDGNQSLKVVRGVDLDMKQGEVYGLVGESGCGKTALALSLLGLIDPPRGQTTMDTYTLEDQDLKNYQTRDWQNLRGKRIAMIFQEPSAFLNPVMTIGSQVAESLLIHGLCSKAEVKTRVLEAFNEMGLPDPLKRYDQYPFEMSGGQLQRVMIAMALISQPALLIADEPTTALDVSVQADILRLLNQLKTKYQMTILFITHDLPLLSQIADHVSVMYCGQIVERGPIQEVLKHPSHPYTQGLLKARPQDKAWQEIYTIPGQVPRPGQVPSGCAFHPRCPRAQKDCEGDSPPLTAINNHHETACIHL